MTAGAPPVLAGFSFIEPIGTGGFADVYLYQQDLPSRRVAVKVLRESTDEVGHAQFHAEVNVMAQLSGHPSIVPIYQADVSADGRAFLVMEYCPPPHIAQRYRKERLPVAEVLEIGVKIASAVETAHRVGILHRDIKPHNILTSTFGAPLLTDFGIAAVAGHDIEGNYGLSVPWSPPEAFGDSAPFDVRSDVYALAATIYSLLAGRSPFEVPGGANDTASLIHRIENQNPTRILRPDLPDSLNDLLARGIARSMNDRPSSAMALARAFQEIQIEMGSAPTRLEVIDASPESAGGGREVADERTLVRPVQIIVPDQIAQQSTMLRQRQVRQPDDRTLRPRRSEPAPDTVHRPRSNASTPLTAPGPDLVAPAIPESGSEDPRPRWPVVLLGTGLAIVLAVGTWAALAFGSADEPDPGPIQAPPSAPILGGPPVPTDLEAERRGGSVVFTWTNPAAAPGDTFQVRSGPTIAGLEETYRGDQARAAVTAAAGDQVCISVRTVRRGAVSEPLQECVAAP